MKVLIIDAGTSSMRGIVMNQKGEMFFTHSVKCVYPQGDDCVAEQKSAFWREALYEILTAVLKSEKKQTFEAVAFTALRSATLAVNKKGEPLTPTLMWQDTRNAEICAQLACEENQILQCTGTMPNTVFSGGKMALLQKLWPNELAKAEKMLTVADYICFLLTGEFVTDYTYGSRSMMMDLRKNQWEETLVKKIGIDFSKLCTLVPPASIVGKTNEKLCKETGFPAGVPVYTAGGDQQCAAIGQTGGEYGKISITVGTGAFIMGHIKTLPQILTREVLFSAAALPKVYIAEASVLGCASVYNWFCKTFYADEKHPNGNMKLADIEVANAQAGTGTLTALPHLQGRGTPDWNCGAAGVLAGLNLNTTRGEIGRALLESIALEIANNIENMQAVGAEITCATLGGGLSKYSEFCKILTSVTGLEIVKQDNSEATAIGAWANTMVPMGVYETRGQALIEAYKNCKKQTFVPKPKLHMMYEEKRREMNKLYLKLEG